MNGRIAMPAWLVWAILSAVFAAGTALLAKVGIQHVDSDVATWVRTVFIAVILAALLLATGKLQSLRGIDGRAWLFLAFSALATGASWICYFRALKVGGAARVAPVDKLSVVLIALFGVLLMGERLTATAWAGIVFVAAGALCVAIG